MRHPKWMAPIALSLFCLVAGGCNNGTGDRGAQQLLRQAVSTPAFRYVPPDSELRTSKDDVEACAHFGVGQHSTNARSSSRHYLVVGLSDAAFAAVRSAFVADGWSIRPDLQPLAEPHEKVVLLSRDFDARTATADVRLDASVIDVTINVPGRGTCGSS